MTGVPSLDLRDEVELDESQYQALLSALDGRVSDEQIIAISDVKQVGMFMPPFFAALCAPNAIEGFRRFALYKRLVCPLEMTLTLDYDQIVIHVGYDGLDGLIPRFALISEQAALVGLIRTGTGKHILPIRIASPYSYSPVLMRHFGMRPTKAAFNILAFSMQDMQTPFLSRNNVMWEYLKSGLDERLEDLSKGDCLTYQVERALMHFIPGNQHTLKNVASRLGVSPRTLQRRLKSKGTSFAALTAQVQQHLATDYLSQGDLTAAEVAHLAGYRDVSSFSRAFKRWTGQSITSFKDERRAPEQGK
ncbi:helix-turn-helix domain-containing protein [Bifidobacterium xylocopae]|uniref:AraC family transcriptional regulator n=1 Tax=Bifidobacterium xylocopae TaxID=2493119 RepID=A0A366KFW6_9BIFI|nr:AraC family transcriptional regulator [Bifidobacterium xylocopae]RBP99983.1 AraC family transcriptional regulator [Bifidobacterium xylocopae]